MNKDKTTGTGPQVTEEMLHRYHAGTLSAAEMHAVEHAALDDPLLAEALEGLEETSPETFAPAMEDLRGRLNSRVAAQEDKAAAPFPLWRGLGLAASLLLILGIGWWSVNTLNSPASDKALSMEAPPLEEATEQAPPIETVQEEGIGSPSDNSDTGSGTVTSGHAEIQIEKELTEETEPAPLAIAERNEVEEIEEEEALEEIVYAYQPQETMAAPPAMASPKPQADTLFALESKSVAGDFGSAEPVNDDALIAEARRMAEAEDEVPIVSGDVEGSAGKGSGGIEVELDGSYIAQYSEEASEEAFADKQYDYSGSDQLDDLSFSYSKPEEDPVWASAQEETLTLAHYRYQNQLVAQEPETIISPASAGSKAPGKKAKRSGQKSSPVAAAPPPGGDFTHAMPSAGLERYDAYLYEQVTALKTKLTMPAITTVEIRFIILSSGQVTDVTIPDTLPETWRIALKNTLSDGPFWIPAHQEGIPLDSRMTLIIDLGH